MGVLLLALSAGALPSCRVGVSAGVAVVQITPPTGYRMAGYFHERQSTGVHDPLNAKAIVLKQGGTRVALVFCDLCAIDPRAAAKARALAEKQTGIPAANITVTATHTHTGPEYYGLRRDRHHAAAVAKHGRDPAEEIDYPAFLAERIAQAVARADKSAAPAALEAGFDLQTGVSFNRRFHMKDGSVVFNPGKLNPNIVKPAGPIDPQVGILLIRDGGDRRPRAALTVFALHLDLLGGTEFAADYPYYVERSLRREWGESFVSLFGPGPCGDINHIDVSHDRRQGGHDFSRSVGEALADSPLDALEGDLNSVTRIGRPAIAMLSRKVTVPVQQYNAEKVRRAKETLEQPNVPFLQLVEAYKVADLDAKGSPETFELEVQALRLDSNTAIVFLPGEVFVELGLAIKGGSPFKRTFVVELTNDTPAYIPTTKAFAEGSYEVVNSRVQPGGGEQLVETALELLRELEKD